MFTLNGGWLRTNKGVGMRLYTRGLALAVCLLICLAGSAYSAALLGTGDMKAVSGGCSNRCRSWVCGGPARDCSPVTQGMTCDNSMSETTCGGAHVHTQTVQACNSGDPALPLCEDGPQTYCGHSFACYCGPNDNKCRAPDETGTSGWYNPCN